MKKKLLMTTAAAVLSLGVLAACGDAEEDPAVDTPDTEDPAGADIEETPEEPADVETDADADVEDVDPEADADADADADVEEDPAEEDADADAADEEAAN